MEHSADSPGPSLPSTSSRTDIYYTPLQVKSASSPIPIPGRTPDTMAAIHNLPVELLSRIFLMGRYEGPYPSFPEDDEVPWEITMTHVCRHWRNVAVHLHSLWSTIHFRLVPHLDRAKYYLTRSQRHLIDILVDTCAVEEHVHGVTLFREEFMPIFNLLTPYIDRWRSLSLKVRDRECKLGARTALSTCGPAPKLEYLQLWHIENWENAERLFTQIGPPPVVIFDKSLPSLQHLVLIGVNVPWTQSPFLEDLSTVEFALHSDEVRIPYDIWSRMLSTSPNLYKLSLHYSGPKASTGEWPEDVIKLPGLRELSLTDLDPPYALQLFKRIAAPGLTELRLELTDQDYTPFLDYLAEVPLPPSTNAEEDAEGGKNDSKGKEKKKEAKPMPLFPSLEKLTITALEATAEGWRKFLEKSRYIRHLELTYNRMADGLFEELYAAPKQQKPAPTTGKGKEKAHDDAESADEEGPRPSTSRSRASSSDTARSESSEDSLSTALTSPRSVHVPLDHPPPRAADDVLLPCLDTLRVVAGSSESLRALIQYRREVGRPVRRWYVDESMRDPELTRLADEMEANSDREAIRWFSRDEEEEEETDEEDEEEYASEEAGDDEEEEVQVAPAGPSSAAVTGAQDIEDDDEVVEYSDEEEEDDDDVD